MAHITPAFSRLITVVFLLLSFSFLPAHATLATSKAPASGPSSCKASDPVIDESDDIQAVLSYKAAIRQLFVAKEFAELDCIANTARTTKAHFSGGRWKLNVFYWAIAEPEGHATEEDWNAHLKILNRWVAAKPQSITARIALAKPTPLTRGTRAAKATPTR